MRVNLITECASIDILVQLRGCPILWPYGGLIIVYVYSVSYSAVLRLWIIIRSWSYLIGISTFGILEEGAQLCTGIWVGLWIGWTRLVMLTLINHRQDIGGIHILLKVELISLEWVWGSCKIPVLEWTWAIQNWIAILFSRSTVPGARRRYPLLKSCMALVCTPFSLKSLVDSFSVWVWDACPTGSFLYSETLFMNEAAERVPLLVWEEYVLFDHEN